jgi:hypothetical protein
MMQAVTASAIYTLLIEQIQVRFLLAKLLQAAAFHVELEK